MLDDRVIHEIEKLLATGRYSQREVARRVGASRGSVNAVAKGRRKVRPPVVKEEDFKQSGPVVRCPECGGRTRMPCRVCGTRRLMRRPVASTSADPTDVDFSLQLDGPVLARYQRLRAWRLRVGNRGEFQEFLRECDEGASRSACERREQTGHGRQGDSPERATDGGRRRDP